MATGGGKKIDKQHILRVTDIAQEPCEVLLPIDGYEEMPLVTLEEAVEKLVHLLPRVQTYAHVAKERCAEPADNLIQDESASIMLYTMGWEPADKCLYVALNATLRSEDRGKLKPWFLYLRLFFNALFRLPSISRTVFRGVKLDLRKQYANGNTIIWWGCSSCTVAISVLQSEDFLGETGVRTMFTVECLHGKDIRKHSYHSVEDEILLLPATHFKVIDSLNQGDLRIIHLQEIVPRFPLLQPVTLATESSLVLSLHNSLVTIKRNAIDPSGRIGSLYDGRQDHIIEATGINIHYNKNQVHPVVKCMVEKGSNIERQNLLQFIGFDDELSLSVALNMVSSAGIASVIEYPYLIDEHIRILYYSYSIRQTFASTDVQNAIKSIQKSISKATTTHVITGIDLGIDVIVLLRLTPDDSKIIDDALNKICRCLANDQKLSNKVLLDGILSTHIYSNISTLTEQKTLLDVYHQICEMKKKSNSYRPTTYILHLIDVFHIDDKKNCVSFIPLKSTIVQKVEQYLFRFLWINKMWSTTLDNDKSNIFHSYLEEQLREVKTQLSGLNEQYKNEKKRLQQLIVNIRYGKDSQKTIEHEILSEKIQSTLKDSIDDLIHSITGLKEKGSFIDDLKRRGFDYQTTKKYEIQQNDKENIIQQKLTGNNPHLRILCSNDLLNESNLSRLEDLCSTLLNEKKISPHLRLIYLDFTYSSYELDQIKVFPLVNRTKDSNERTSLLLTKTERSKHGSSIDDKTINILLLGKSGVGKSTLINTFINYLKFNRQEDIQPNRFILHVLIPFTRSVMIDFEEHLVRFGLLDRNEDFDHPDQSTTQQCKFYNFKMNNNEKICIIDTPGFGQNNDDITMQHILSRIMNLTHLNIICVLIQSDDNQLSDYQICLTKLFHFLGNNAISNIVFCFTKVLSNAINSDQRNHLIKLMLETLPTANIPFNEETTFDFDSSYFIDSTMSHRFASSIHSSNQTSKESWRISKNGWDRLLNYTRQNLHPYLIQQGLEKVELARLEISQLIRPILETLRNNLRNFILSKTGYSNYSIELHPTPLYSSAICYSCKRPYYRCGEFLIMSDSPHEYRNTCYKCSCPSEQHVRIDYRLEYKYVFNQTNNRSLQASILSEDLLHISVDLAYFFMHGNQITNNDPFFIYLNHMIDEERFICGNISSNRLNMALHHQLIHFRQDYQRRINAMKEKEFHSYFDIDDSIEKIKQISMVKIQLDAARKIPEVSV